MDDRNWDNYYKMTKQSTPPRKTLVKAIEVFHSRSQSAQSKVAIDLGCGAGTDTIELLTDGWSVLAIDSQAEAIATLLSICPKSLQKRLKTKTVPFELLTSLPRSQLINASYSLPFLSVDKFYPFWELILRTLRPGDLFSGILFGINDSWNSPERTDMTFLNDKELHHLLIPFEVELLEEEENNEADAIGHMKHWHRYFIVAQKR